MLYTATTIQSPNHSTLHNELYMSLICSLLESHNHPNSVGTTPDLFGCNLFDCYSAICKFYKLQNIVLHVRLLLHQNPEKPYLYEITHRCGNKARVSCQNISNFNIMYRRNYLTVSCNIFHHCSIATLDSFVG